MGAIISWTIYSPYCPYGTMLFKL